MQSGKIYYAKHIEAGLANYGDENILIANETLKRMNPTFQGKPVYVNHDNEPKNNVSDDAVGYVIRSFFNELDGCHWAEILITDDAGEKAIAEGYGVSNSYGDLVNNPGGGEWHAIPYDREIIGGKYRHLALVRTPRYENSKILDATSYEKYCDRCREELLVLRNSKQENDCLSQDVKISTMGDLKMEEEIKQNEGETGVASEQLSTSELESKYHEVLEELGTLRAKVASMNGKQNEDDDDGEETTKEDDDKVGDQERQPNIANEKPIKRSVIGAARAVAICNRMDYDKIETKATRAARGEKFFGPAVSLGFRA
jgi:hypothetical protein